MLDLEACVSEKECGIDEKMGHSGWKTGAAASLDGAETGQRSDGDLCGASGSAELARGPRD